MQILRLNLFSLDLFTNITKIPLDSFALVSAAYEVWKRIIILSIVPQHCALMLPANTYFTGHINLSEIVMSTHMPNLVSIIFMLP